MSLELTAFKLTPGQEADLVKVLTYKRVSTVRQVRKDGDVGSLEKQDESMRALVESHAASSGWKVAGSITDAAKAGDNPHRPGLRRLREAARRGEFNVLVVFAQDRLARDWETVKKTIRELEALGVQIYSSNGSRITHRTLEGVTTSMILAVMSELGLETIRFGRMKDIATTAAMGKWIGGRASMGYLAVKGKGRRRDLVADKGGFAPHATEIITRIAKNEPPSIVIADLDVREIRTPSMVVKRDGKDVELGRQPIELKHIQSIVMNPIYMGFNAVKNYERARALSGAGLPEPYKMLPDGTALYKGDHEALVSEDVGFRAYTNFVNRHKLLRKPRSADAAGNFLLQGLIRCSACERTMTPRRARGARNYTCMAAYLGGKGGHNCPICSVPAAAVETAVLQLFSATATHTDILDHIFARKNPPTSQTAERLLDGRNAMKKLKEQCDRLIAELGIQVDRYVRHSISERLRDLGTELGELERSIQDALAEDPNMDRTRAAFTRTAQRVLSAYDQHSQACRPELKVLLKALLTAVYIESRPGRDGKRAFAVELRLRYAESAVDNGVKVPVKVEFVVDARGRSLEVTKPFRYRCSLQGGAPSSNPALLLLEKYFAMSQKMTRAEIAKHEGKERAHVTQVLSLLKIPAALRAKIAAAPAEVSARFSQNRLRKIAALRSDAEMQAHVDLVFGSASAKDSAEAA